MVQPFLSRFIARLAEIQMVLWDLENFDFRHWSGQAWSTRQRCRGGDGKCPDIGAYQADDDMMIVEPGCMFHPTRFA